MRFLYLCYDFEIRSINSLMTDRDIIAEYDSFMARGDKMTIGSFMQLCLEKFPNLDSDFNEIVRLLGSRKEYSYDANVNLYKTLNDEYDFEIPEYSVIKAIVRPSDLIMRIFMQASNRIGLTFFKYLFVNCVKNVPDNSIKGGYGKDGLIASYHKITHIPYFIKKFNDLKKLNVNNSNIVKVEAGDIPDSVESIHLAICDQLESVVVDHYVRELNLANNPKLNKVVCKFLPSDTNLEAVDEMDLNLSHCPEIKSGKNISVTAGAGSVTITNQDILPSSLKAPLELSKRYNISIVIGNWLESFEGFNYKDVEVAFTFYEYLRNIKSFYGLANPSIRSFYSSWKGTYLHADETLFNKHFLQIKNAYKVFGAYIDIMKAYPDLLTNPTLGAIYKMYNPTSLKEFETLLTKIKSYNADLNYIGLLSNLLLK